MKKILLSIASIGAVLILSSQSNEWCVMHINGDVNLPEKCIEVGDTIYTKDILSLEFNDNSSAITLYNSDKRKGVRRINSKNFNEIISRIGEEKVFPDDEDDFFDLIANIFGVKSQSIDLKSRGDCECLNPLDCLLPNTELSEWTILSNPIKFSSSTIGKGSYFVQFEHEGKTKTRMLRQQNGSVIIEKEKFLVNDTSYYNFDLPAFLGFISEGNRHESPEIICLAKFRIISDQEIRDYVRMNKGLMDHLTEEKLEQELIYSLYVSYGKPRLCDLKDLLK